MMCNADIRKIEVRNVRKLNASIVKKIECFHRVLKITFSNDKGIYLLRFQSFVQGQYI